MNSANSNACRGWIAILSVLACFQSIAYAQYNAVDWTKSDCEGVTHTLFNDLNEGKIVIMDFVMIPDCQPCIDASIALPSLVASLPTEISSRVKVYTMGYSDAYTCAALTKWKESNNIGSTLFEKAASIVSHYGGMGMPTIVIAAGTDRRVIYRKKGFSMDDTLAIRTAIQAEAKAEVTSSIPTSTYSVYTLRNGQENLVMESPTTGPASLMIFDAIGRIVLEMSHHLTIGENSIKLPHMLQPGAYHVQLLTSNSMAIVPFFCR